MLVKFKYDVKYVFIKSKVSLDDADFLTKFTAYIDYFFSMYNCYSVDAGVIGCEEEDFIVLKLAEPGCIYQIVTDDK